MTPDDSAGEVVVVAWLFGAGFKEAAGSKGEPASAAEAEAEAEASAVAEACEALVDSVADTSQGFSVPETTELTGRDMTGPKVAIMTPLASAEAVSCAGGGTFAELACVAHG